MKHPIRTVVSVAILWIFKLNTFTTNDPFIFFVLHLMYSFRNLLSCRELRVRESVVMRVESLVVYFTQLTDTVTHPVQLISDQEGS